MSGSEEPAAGAPELCATLVDITTLFTLSPEPIRESACSALYSAERKPRPAPPAGPSSAPAPSGDHSPAAANSTCGAASDDSSVTVRVVSKRRKGAIQAVQEELCILSLLGLHPNVLGVLEVLEGDQSVYLVC
eukprot:RCo012222